MKDSGLDETVNSLRRIATTGAVVAVVVLVGAVVLMALSVLTSLARFSPYGLWGIIAVLAVAGVVGLLVWLRGPGTLGLARRPRPSLAMEVLRAPPPPPVRAPVSLNGAHAPAGRLGMEASLNRLVEQRRYDDALRRLDEIEAADPAMATFSAVKRRAIARRRARNR